MREEICDIERKWLVGFTTNPNSINSIHKGKGVAMGDKDEDERGDAQQQKVDSVDGSVERGLTFVR